MKNSRDHISLVFDLPGGNESDGISKRRSIYRHWNQLSRLQRNTIFFVVIAVFLTIFLLLQNDTNMIASQKDDDKNQIHISALVNEPSIDQIIDKAEIKLDSPLIEPPESQINNDPVQVQQPLAPPQQQQQQQQQEPPLQPPKQDIIENDLNHIEHNLIDNAVDQPNVEKIFSRDGDTDVHIEQSQLKAQKSQQDQEELAKAIETIEKHIIDTNNEYVLTPKSFKGPSNERQLAVVNAFKHAWKGYKEFAWGHDHLKPISMSSHDWFGLGLTIIDSLDTMYIMNLHEEFDEARDWIEQHLNFDANRDINLFEVTIRVLGGLLATYHLSGDKIFLSKSIDLGRRLLPCFNSPSGIPFSDVNMLTLNAHSPKWSPDSSTSEVTTIQLEFRDLSRVTGDPIYEQVSSTINEKIHNLEKKDGLVPIFINANTGTFRSFSTISLGARGDSYYEYLLKQWLQTGKKENDFLIEDYKIAIDGVIKHLVRTTPNEHHVYIGELLSGKDFKPKMDHLTCYLPGTLLLGYYNGMPMSHFKLAKDLLETCYQTYMKQPTGLAPEITYFNLQGESETDIYVKSNDAHNLLRPEFIESLYYFYVLTGNQTYQDMGWSIFKSFEKYTKVTNGYTAIGNVKSQLNTRPRDMMESFFLSETLKYFYLLFSDDRYEINLNKFVFNSEAHPLPI